MGLKVCDNNLADFASELLFGPYENQEMDGDNVVIEIEQISQEGVNRKAYWNKVRLALVVVMAVVLAYLAYMTRSTAVLAAGLILVNVALILHIVYIRNNVTPLAIGKAAWLQMRRMSYWSTRSIVMSVIGLVYPRGPDLTKNEIDTMLASSRNEAPL
jgi:hypothetical protein